MSDNQPPPLKSTLAGLNRRLDEPLPPHDEAHAALMHLGTVTGRFDASGRTEAKGVAATPPLVHSFGMWYPIDRNAPLSKPIGETHEVLLGAHDRRALGFIYDLGDELKPSAAGYLGFEWTHWSPLPDVKAIKP